ncbi:MAG: MarR family transcriptional regulator [Lachnospiraceae bacterium]|nr:MarR family transcriptional regulator [Lachnospiraceae bacterium]
MKSDRVLSSLIRIHRKRICRLKREMAPYHYVGTMYLIVFYLRRHPGASQEDIAAFHFLDKTSVARDARRLEDMGHIRREIDPENRRQYRLFLTPEGTEFLKILDGFHDEFAEQIFEGFTEEEWETLADLLERVEANCCDRTEEENVR